MRPVTLARLACIISFFSLASRCRPSAFPLLCGPSGAPLVLVSASGEGVLRLVADTRNPFFREKCIFYDKHDFPYVLRGLG